MNLGRISVCPFRDTHFDAANMRLNVRAYVSTNKKMRDYKRIGQKKRKKKKKYKVGI